MLCFEASTLQGCLLIHLEDSYLARRHWLQLLLIWPAFQESLWVVACYWFKLALQKHFNLGADDCMIARTNVTRLTTRTNLRYLLPIKGNVVVWFKAPVTIPGYGEMKSHWKIPVSTVLLFDQVWLSRPSRCVFQHNFAGNLQNIPIHCGLTWAPEAFWNVIILKYFILVSWQVVGEIESCATRT